MLTKLGEPSISVAQHARSRNTLRYVRVCSSHVICVAAHIPQQGSVLDLEQPKTSGDQIWTMPCSKSPALRSLVVYWKARITAKLQELGLLGRCLQVRRIQCAVFLQGHAGKQGACVESQDPGASSPSINHRNV